MRFLESGPDVPLAEQSADPSRRGVPWWGAVVIAFGFAIAGIAVDSLAARAFGFDGGINARQIGFAIGCLVAALTVRNRALFTAAVQPPLVAVGVVILRVIGVKVKGLVTSANVPELNSLLIKQVFSFSNDFPVILFTFLASLTVVLVRWWRYNTARRAEPPAAATTVEGSKTGTAKAGSGPIKRAAAPKPESAAARASRAAAAAQQNPAQNEPAPRGDTPTRRVRPTGEPGFRAAPAVIPRGRAGDAAVARSAGPAVAARPGEPAVRPNADRMTAGAMARGVRLDNEDASTRPSGTRPPAVRPAQQARPPAPTAPPAQGRRRAAPPPLDDDGF
ncbi:MAG: hypothetical protein EKK60_02425 [Gordonia sp. (in: high G+C Gram-positive bacteria)]|nr:MAG: hypothetical protein EKK60_02425 [Gordonia sp. (in: high G+C Gram-positive bacteria)]